MHLETLTGAGSLNRSPGSLSPDDLELALANGRGGPNPTNTGQALALRTADRIGALYF